MSEHETALEAGTESSRADDTNVTDPASEENSHQETSPSSSAPKPSPLSGRPSPSPAATSTAAPAAKSDSEKWGRAEADGTVYLVLPEGEKAVGQYPGASPEEALAYFARKFDDIEAQFSLLEQRLKAGASLTDIRNGLKPVIASINENSGIGDLPGLQSRIAALETQLDEAATRLKIEQEEARKKTLETRESIISEAEEIAAKEPQTVQWKQSRARLAELLDAWKTEQRSSPRIPKSAEDELWKRFRVARNTFEKKRHDHFAVLDEQRDKVKKTKEALITKAQELSESTDWSKTSEEYRGLLQEWKKAGRAGRKDEDELWNRFKAAQDVFFQARAEANQKQDAEYSENLKVKEAILAEAEQLVPVTDVKKAKGALRSLQERWEQAGKVPRSVFRKTEDRFKAVERRIQDAENDQWKKTDPEIQNRAQSALGQLEKTISDLESQLEKAQASGNQKKITELQDSLTARKSWLEQIQKSAN